MTFGTFVIKNSFRNKRRTALTVLSIGFSLFLLIMLQTLISFFTNPPAGERQALRVVVARSTAFVDQMPLGYETKLETVPHVAMVCPVQIYGGYYRDPKAFFPSLAADPAKIWEVFPENHASDEAKQALMNEKTGAIVGVHLMEKFDWHVGDRVTLIGTLQAVDLEFKIVGTYESDIPNNNDAFYFSYDYLNEMMGKPNTVGLFWLLADAPQNIPSIMNAVDDMFHNSPAETKTQTEKAFVLGFVGMMGNIRLLMGSIALVVLFTMLLVAASTMAMTVRERLREVAILKSIGFPQRIVLALILGEAVFISLLGAAIGCLFGGLLRLVDMGKFTGGFIQDFPVAYSVLGLALLVGAAIGLVSAFLPALRASKMTITEALRRLD